MPNRNIENDGQEQLIVLDMQTLKPTSTLIQGVNELYRSHFQFQSLYILNYFKHSFVDLIFVFVQGIESQNQSYVYISRFSKVTLSHSLANVYLFKDITSLRSF